MNKKLTTKQEKLQKLKIQNEIDYRYFNRNIEAMSWCNKQGLTIYVSAQSQNSTMVKIFIQKGIPFKPLNNILYNQNDYDDVKKYISVIDSEYERLYVKMKSRV